VRADLTVKDLGEGSSCYFLFQSLLVLLRWLAGMVHEIQVRRSDEVNHHVRRHGSDSERWRRRRRSEVGVAAALREVEAAAAWREVEAAVAARPRDQSRADCGVFRCDYDGGRGVSAMNGPVFDCLDLCGLGRNKPLLTELD
jgi:hypothetical protein